MLAFTNEKIETPDHNTNKSEIIKENRECIRKTACNLSLLLYHCLRYDVLAYVVPHYLTLEKESLLLPEAITS